MSEKLKNNKLLVIVAVIYLLLAVIMNDWFVTAIGNSTYYLKEMMAIMPVIFMLTVGIEVLIPKEWVIKRMGEGSGGLGYVFALIFGSISAGPIYATFPICKILLNKGANIGNVVIILSAWAVVKVPMLANEAKFIGPEFMAIRWVLTVVMIFVIGWWMDKQMKLDDLPQMMVTDQELLSINEGYCIGCGLCTKLSPESFYMEGGKAKVQKDLEVDTRLAAAIEKAVKKCPANVIRFQG